MATGSSSRGPSAVTLGHRATALAKLRATPAYEMLLELAPSGGEAKGLLETFPEAHSELSVSDWGRVLKAWRQSFSEWYAKRIPDMSDTRSFTTNMTGSKQDDKAPVHLAADRSKECTNTWEKTLAKRLRVVASIRETVEYQQSLRGVSYGLVAETLRPRTPDPYDCILAKRDWEDQVIEWRHQLKRCHAVVNERLYVQPEVMLREAFPDANSDDEATGVSRMDVAR